MVTMALRCLFSDHLEAAGFHHVTVVGNWDGAPVDDNSRILLFRSERG
jgi:hypothetical protein